MVQIYRKKWERGFFSSLFGYLRDVLILSLPIKRLPRFLVKILYGVDIRFAFLVHPRTYQDVFISIPFLNPLKFFLKRQRGYKFVSRFPPFVLNYIRTEHRVNGIVVAQPTVPELLFDRRKESIAMLELSLKLVSKLGCSGTVAGLGGWLPMIVRRGVALEKVARNFDLKVTNGHCGTLASIFMMVERISKITEVPLKDFVVVVIGVGKMGTNVAKALCGSVRSIVLVDISDNNLRRAREQMVDKKTSVETVLTNVDDNTAVRDALRKSHIGICATSTFRNLLRLRDIPDGFIAIDDSRPEALPRDLRRERLILEGGLLKIKGANLNYDFGFGQDDNVFGCLGEAFLLALDRGKTLQPTVGDVDFNNFWRLVDFCKSNNVSEGDLKSSDNYITDDEIRAAFQKRGLMKVK